MNQYEFNGIVFQQQEYQLIQTYLKKGVDIKPLLNPLFNLGQLHEIGLGLLDGIDVCYADPKYNTLQMRQIRYALLDKVDYRWLLNENLDWQKMLNIRMALLDGCPLIDIFKNSYLDEFMDVDELDAYSGICDILDEDCLDYDNLNVFHPNKDTWIVIDYDAFPESVVNGVGYDTLHELDKYFYFNSKTNVIEFNPPSNLPGVYYNERAWEILDQAICTSLSFYETFDDAQFLVDRLRGYFDNEYSSYSYEMS